MQFIDLKAQYSALKNEIDAGINAVLTHGQFIHGPEVAKLERELAAFAGVKYCITCANGTDALQLLFMAYGIGAGDAVFCPDVTFIASVEPACMLGAVPVFCDIDNDTWNICPQSLERQIKAVVAEGKYTPRAVIAVDFLGNPADYDKICKLCAKYDILVIEDAAQSFGASIGGKHCGSFGDAATTSFFPAKPLGCYGDGGAVLANDDNIADICRSICVHGKGPNGKYDNVRVGMNSRLDTLQAAILLPKLKALREYEIDRRQEVATRYNKAFAQDFQLQRIADYAVSVWAQYALLAKDTAQRDKIIAHLSASKIPNMVYYPTPQHELPVFAGVNHYGETFANANDYCARTFSLPMHPYLESAQQDKIIKAVVEAI